MKLIELNDIAKIENWEVGIDDHQPFVEFDAHLKDGRIIKVGEWVSFRTAGDVEEEVISDRIVEVINTFIEFEEEEG